jgi:Fe-S-cluster containining protein
MTRSKSVAAVVDPLLDRLAYRCFPDGCPASGSSGPMDCCCVGAAVEVSRAESTRINSALAGIAALQPRLRDAAGLIDVFVEEERGLTIEAADEQGTCPFLFRRKGKRLCAIHSWAVGAGVDVASVKPRACRLWPLIVEIREGVRTISIHPDALRIGCVAPRAALPGQPTVRAAFAAELAELAKQ